MWVWVAWCESVSVCLSVCLRRMRARAYPQYLLSVAVVYRFSTQDVRQGFQPALETPKPEGANDR